MKIRKLFALAVTLLSVAVIGVFTASAETYGDYSYEILDNGTVEITGYYGSATTLSIPSKINGKTVTSIAWGAFEFCYNVTSVTIPNGVKSIGDGAFAYCVALKSVTIPESVTSIGEYLFENCSSLTTINVNSNNKYFSSKDGILFDKNKTKIIAYPAGITKTSYVIPDSVTNIAEGAFYWCSNLKNVTIPNTVQNVGGFAFFGCKNLVNITIPNSVTSIGDKAFGYYAYYDIESGTTLIPLVDGFKISCYSGTAGEKYAKDNHISYELLSVTAPSTPTAFKMALNSSSSVRLSWNKVSGANGYIIEQYKNGAWSRVTKITNPTTTVYSVKSLAGGTTFKFRIRAYAMDGSKAYYSPYSTTLTTITKPATPKVKMEANSPTSVRLSWGKVTGAGGYIIEQYKNGAWTRIAKVTGGSTLQYSVKSLASGTTFKFRVKAYKMLGSSAYYSAYSSTVTTITKPAQVKAKVASTTTTAKLSWGKVTGAGGYIIEKYDGSKWVRVAKVTGTSTVSYTVTGLKSKTTTQFRVRAYKMLGSTAYYGSYSPTVSAKTK